MSENTARKPRSVSIDNLENQAIRIKDSIAKSEKVLEGKREKLADVERRIASYYENAEALMAEKVRELEALKASLEKARASRKVAE